ncbi:aldehyde dehydrogenase [Streptomyces antimycoticus]|uniref:aldehyde dehydrogenase n=1 Tax=Streptomyces antimycoticus TaxID=68175 RepID=UPI000A382B91|nr:aldehyde dehydrogenase [Streptomyces antimycoticus]
MSSNLYDGFYIDGAWSRPSSPEVVEVVSASTEELVGTAPVGANGDIDAAVAAARRAFDDPNGWQHWSRVARADAMESLADALDSRSGEMARRVATQNGMPVSVANGFEGAFPQTVLRYYAALIRETDLEETRQGLLGGRIRVRRLPVGVVGAIVPWNFPQTLAAFKLGPALALGCTLVIKPSPETVWDAHLFAEAVHESSIPDGVINIVPGGREIGAHLVAHPGVDKIAFTGSTAAGRKVAQTCGRLLRPVTLELGGKSAAIVLDDADLNTQMRAMFDATMINNGQTCYLGTRVLAPRSRYDEVLDALTTFVGELQVGDALDPGTEIGPLASAGQRDRVESYIESGRDSGFTITTGGGRPKGLDRGWFVEPTIFANVDNTASIARDEIFGPVLVVIQYDDIDDAVAIANDSEFGLGGSVWSTDAERGESVARRILTGTVGVNNFLSDPVAPFGGIKSSGIGRELGPEGLVSYQNLQSIYLDGGGN